MSIKDVEKLGARQIESVRRKQANEISRLEQGHKDLKVELKKANDAEIVDIENENIRSLDKENEKKEKVMETMRQHLDSTKKITDKQIRELKETSEKVKKDEHAKLSVDRDRVNAENELHLDQMHHNFKKEFKNVSEDGKKQIDTLKDAKNHELSEKEGFYQDKMNAQTNTFTERFQNDSRNYKKIKDDQDGTFKKERASTNIRQQQEIGKLTNTHTSALEVRDNEFRKGLKEQNLMFEKKFAANLQARNTEMGGLEAKNQQVLGKMKNELSNVIVNSKDRSGDKFYEFTELKTHLKQFEDRVEIQVEVPEHAKTDVQLNLHDKEAIVTFNRRYVDSRSTENSLNKLNKVESFSSRINTGHFLDPKSVKSSYADGMMTYVVKHA